MQEQTVNSDQITPPNNQNITERSQSPIVETPQTTISHTPKQNYWQILAIALLLLLLGTIGVLAYSLSKDDKQALIIQPSPSPVMATNITSSPSPLVGNSQPTVSPLSDETANWKTYKGKMYTFKYPADYSVTEDNEPSVTLSHNTAEFLSIYAVETLTYDNFFECSATVTQDCQVRFSSQKNLIEDILVSGHKGKSFYTKGGGLDNDYHRVEVIKTSGEEFNTGLNAFIGDINLDKARAQAQDQIFLKILSTFKFVN